VFVDGRQDDDDRSDAARVPARRVGRSDGRSDKASGNALDAPRAREWDFVAAVGVQSDEEPYALTRSEQFSGPIPSPRALEDYEAVVPGSARQLIDGYMARDKAATDAVVRLTGAEVRAASIGSVFVGLVAVLGLVVTALALRSDVDAWLVVLALPAVFTSIGSIFAMRR
jgi:uncharacterized membrane protein